MPRFHKAPCMHTCRSHLRNLYLKWFLYICGVHHHLACMHVFKPLSFTATWLQNRSSIRAHAPQTKLWLFTTDSVCVVVKSEDESIDGMLLLFCFFLCTANYMSSCPRWCSLSHSIKRHRRANCITSVINITRSCNHPRCFITLTRERREKKKGIRRWSMATFHTTFQKIHSEVAAVLKLSRSSLAKPDKSASVRVSAQKALPKLIPSLPCFPAFVFPLLIGSWGCWIDGGWGRRGSNMRNVFALKAKCREESLKILWADRWWWWLTDIVSHEGDLLESSLLRDHLPPRRFWSRWINNSTLRALAGN